MKEPKYPEIVKLHGILEDMEKRLHFEHWRNADLKEKLSYARDKITRLLLALETIVERDIPINIVDVMTNTEREIIEIAQNTLLRESK